MKIARRSQDPGRSQTRLQSSALLQNDAVRTIQLLTTRKSMSKTSADDEEQVAADRSQKRRVILCNFDVNAFLPIFFFFPKQL
jgi:hypothetical protein